MKNTGTPPKGKQTADEQKQTAPAVGAAGDLRALLLDCLKDIYWAEAALVKALPKMVQNAETPSLKAVISEHLLVTVQHVVRLEEVFSFLGEKAEGKKCEAMAGLIKEADSMLEETIPGPVRDAAIIAAAQKVEHYEIATYGTLCTFAKTIGENDVAMLLHKTLAEEKEADLLLSDAAFNAINFDAAVSV
jgi:ferritin-like metal-binding protein YciE